jgi:hypothetical protein
MDEIDYAPLLPTQAPEGLVSYILGQGALWKEYLVYKAAWEYAP